VILVDTSVWIDFFNGHQSVESAYLRTCISDAHPLVVPGLVLTEILMGLRTESDATRVADGLSGFDEAPPLDTRDSRKAAQIYRECRNRGRTIRSTIDCVIAQLCLRHGYELLAKDRDFESIAQVFPLRRVAIPMMVHDRPNPKSQQS